MKNIAKHLIEKTRFTVKITSDPDPLSSETDQRIRIRIKIKRIRNTDLPCGTQVPVISSLP